MAMYNEITVEAELTNTEYMITKNYNLLENKPQINSVELMGNKSLEDLGINPDAEENIIDTVKINGAALTPDANKAVDVTITTGTDNGTVKVNGTDVNVKGLKSAAYTESSAYDVSGAAATVQGNVDALAVVVSGKVDKVQGKGLSTNDYTNEDKTKLAGIQAGAQVNTVTSVAGKTGAVTLNKSDVGLGNVNNTSDANKPVSNATQNALNLKADTSAVNTALAGKVDKVEGYGLSENDYTTAEKTKLAGISAEANKVGITPVVTEGTTLATISIDGVDTAIKGSDIDVDDTPSPTSTNPLENKAVYELVQSILPEKTATGNPISIDDASGLNAKSCEVTMNPIQEGTGDPSPSNIRPISGRDSVDVVVTGANQWDEEWELGTYNTTTGEKSSSASNIRSKNKIPVFQGKTYSFVIPTGITMRYLLYNKDESYSGLTGTKTNGGTLEIPSDIEFMTFHLSSGTTYNNDISINYPSTVTTYNAYNGQTKTITFPSTIYGGTNEVVGGTAVSNMRLLDLGSKTWSRSTSYTNPFFYTNLTDEEASTLTNNGICEIYAKLPRTTNIDGQYFGNQAPNSTFALGTYNGRQIFIRDDSYTNSDDFKTAMSGVQLCYELATPTPFSTTPTPIPLNKGNNVVSTDGDDITLKYSADIKAYIDSQLASVSE